MYGLYKCDLLIFLLKTFQGADREYWHWTDLNIGTVLSVYGREITLTNCDSFTRSHLASEGVELAPMETGPPDIYQAGQIFSRNFLRLFLLRQELKKC